MPTTSEVQFVVARYGEDLSWLLRPEILPYAANAIIYNKGADNISETIHAAVKEVVQLPNVGRAEHSYMYHIVNSVKNDALFKYTVFVPGSVYTSGEHKVNQFNTILHFLRTGAPIPTWVENIYAMFRDFTLDNWCATCPENSSLNSEKALHPARVRPMGNWVHAYFGSAAPVHDKRYPITLFAVACGYRDSILRIPITVFETIMDQLAEHSNPEVGHYVERIFGYLVCNNAPFVHMPINEQARVAVPVVNTQISISKRQQVTKRLQPRRVVVRSIGIRRRGAIATRTSPFMARRTVGPFRRQRMIPIR